MRVQFLDVLVEDAVHADGLFVRARIGHRGGGEFEEGQEELLLLRRIAPEGGLPKREHAERLVGGSDRMPEFQLVLRRHPGVSRRPWRARRRRATARRASRRPPSMATAARVTSRRPMTVRSRWLSRSWRLSEELRSRTDSRRACVPVRERDAVDTVD